MDGKIIWFLNPIFVQTFSSPEAQGKSPLFVVIDGNHLIHRAFHAIQAPLKTSSGEQTNALYGFASMLLNIMETEKPDALAVAFDMRAPTFRHELHDGYKATRSKSPDELYAQIPRIHEMVNAFRIPVFQNEGYEADDMMGTLACQAEEKGMVTRIVTGDMDALQLISERTFVVFPHKGYREPILFDEAKVVEKYGIRPSQVVDYKALMGDSSDNIKGVEGIGPKRAAALLQRYGRLEEIFSHVAELPEALRQKIEAGQDAAFFSRKLARIVCDAPCAFSPESVSVNHLDFVGFQRFLEKMEMKSLQARLRRLTPVGKEAPPDQMALF